MKVSALALALCVVPAISTTPSQQDGRDLAQGIFRLYSAARNLNDQYRLFSSVDTIDINQLLFNGYVLQSLINEVSSVAATATEKLSSQDALVVQNAFNSLNSVLTSSASNAIAKRSLFSSAGYQDIVAEDAIVQKQAGKSMYSAIKSRFLPAQTSLVASDANVFYSKYSSVIASFPTSGP